MSDWKPHWIWLVDRQILYHPNPDWPKRVDVSEADENALLFALDPANGLSIRDAMIYYGDPFMAGRYRGWLTLSKVPAGQEGALTPRRWGELISFGNALREDEQHRLGSGVHVAKGFRGGDVKMSVIPSEWLRQARINEKDSSAEFNGVRIVGIRIFKREQLESATPGHTSAVGDLRPPAKRRGRKGDKQQAVKEAILADIHAGKYTLEDLEATSPKKVLHARYNAKRYTFEAAFDAVRRLSELSANVGN